MNKKIILSFLLVFLIALSVSAVSADDGADVVAIDEDVDIVEVDDSAEALSAEPIQPKNNTVADVQTAVNSANKTGDIVDLSNHAEYDFGNSTVTIANSNIIVDGKGTTTIKGDGAGAGLFQVTGKNVTIQGITFIDTNKKNNFTYGGSVNGVGIRFNGANNGVLSDCMFNDFNSAVQVMGTTGLLVENNGFYGGYTTLIANDPTVNVETGSKSLNIYKQSSGVTIRNNVFDGPILDAISIAQGSGSNIVENNVFVGNTYSIYFGGASTNNTVVRNNTFNGCGEFKRDGQYWERLPVISIQKASTGIDFIDNTFVAVENSILIAAEQGNGAHGLPTSIGNINVVNSTVDTIGLADPSAVVLFHVLVRNGELNLTGPIVFENNTLNGATENVTWNLADGNEYPITPTANTAEAVQKAMDAANDGDTIDLSGLSEYDFANATVTISNNNVFVIGPTTIKGDGAGAGLFQVTGKNVTIIGINFVDTNNKNNFTYGGSVNGVGIRFNGANNGVLQYCEFTDFNSAVQVMGTTGLLVENNGFYGGYTTLIANDPTVNVETGSKSLNIYKQSSGVTIRNNVFDGPILDAISIAQGSGSNIVENNVFIGNTYSIYFGGASTNNTVVRNNTFNGCGEFKRDGQYWERLPVISIQKASTGIDFIDNTFVAVENSILIAAEQGNGAHGLPTSIGNINVINSTVDTSSVSNASAVVLFHVLVRNGELNLTGPIVFENNTLNGATENVTWYLANGNEYPITPTANTAEAVQKAMDAANDGDTIDLTHFDEYDLGNNTVTVSNNVTLQGNGNTVVKGNLTVQDGATVTLKDVAEATIVTPQPIPAPVVADTAISSSDVTVTAGESGDLKITLKDASGNVLSGKSLTVVVNGVSSNVVTGSDGVATFSFKYDSASTYYATIMFMGDELYKSSVGSAKITVKAKPVPPVSKKATKITAKKKTFKVKTKTKKYTITLKAGSAAVKKVKVTLKVKGKTYKATTNTKGKATFKIKNLKKKGKYNAVIKFAGNSNYKASSAKAKITVKK